MEKKIFGTIVKLETITNWNLNEKHSVRKFLIISQEPLEKEKAYSFIEKFITSPRKFRYPKPTGEMSTMIQGLEIIKDVFPWRKENLGKLGCEIPITLFHELDETLFFSIEESKELSLNVLKSGILENKFDDFMGSSVINEEIEIGDETLILRGKDKAF